MKDETQALHLETMMQDYLHYSKYELALPLVRVGSFKLKKLSVDDVLLLDLKVLVLVLIQGDTICADLILKTVECKYVTEIIQLHQKTIVKNNSNKYKILKCSLGEFPMKRLEVGNRIDMAQLHLENITLVLNEKNVAEGSLINVDDTLAVKINKVIQ